jgi:hypothetical protein
VLDPELLKILACPMCKADVKLEKGELVCAKCGRHYPIVEGIPCMLPDELMAEFEKQVQR